jgi:5'-3' exonuclease
MLILIDGNAMGYAHHNGTTLNHGTMQTQAVYGFARMLRDMRFSNQSAEIMVLWDGRAQFRYELFPDYKSNRDVSDDPVEQKHKEAYRAQVPYIKAMCKALGIKQVRAPELEADDLAGYFVGKMKSRTPILLVTGDQDWLQLVDKNVSWLDPRKEGRKVTFETFLDSTGYHSPEEFLEGKALQGDDSDTVPGVGGLGKGTAPKFLAKWKSVQNFFDAVDAGTYKPATRKAKNAKTQHPEQSLASDKGRLLFARNMQLMNLRDAPKPNTTTIEVTRDSCRTDLARALCERLGFLSILNQWETWVAPFETKKEEAVHE